MPSTQQRVTAAVYVTALVAAAISLVLLCGPAAVTQTAAWHDLSILPRAAWGALWATAAVACPAAWRWRRRTAPWALHAVCALHSITAFLYGLSARAEHGHGLLAAVTFAGLALYSALVAWAVTSSTPPARRETHA